MKNLAKAMLLCGLGVVVAYCMTLAYVVHQGDALAFTQKPATYDRSECEFVTSDKGDSIAYHYYKHDNPKGVILYSHGSAVDIGEMSYLLQGHLLWGYDVVCYDYPGIGLSSGECSEVGTFSAIHAIYDMLIQERHYDANQIILIGRSVGTAPSIQLAGEREVGALILVSPFLSSLRVATYFPIFPVDLFENETNILKLNIPTLIIHGSNDETVPLWHAEQLKEKQPELIDLAVIDNYGHADVHRAGGYSRAAANYLKRVGLR